MGVFINNRHPGVFKSDADILGKNQGQSKIDPIAEWMNEQQEACESISRQLIDLESSVKRQKHVQSEQMIEIRHHLNELTTEDVRRERFEDDVLKSLSAIRTENKFIRRMLEQGHTVNKEFAVKVNSIIASNEKITERLGEYVSTNEEIQSKINGQTDVQRQMFEQISRQEAVQQEVVSRLENQEGLMDKMLRQMDHLRTVLYERTNFLTKKIEDSYHTTSSFVAKLMTGTELPLTRFLMNQKKEEQRKDSN